MIEKLWDNPEIYQIFIPMPENPLKNLNCYVIREGQECLIIDTGFNRSECAEALKAGLAELQIRPEQTRLFITHMHSDHCGLANEFAAKGIPIYMSGIDHDYLRRTMNGNNWPALEAFFLREGFPESEMALQVSGNQARRYAPNTLFPINRVADGDKLTLGPWTFVCIHTPGHTPGHMCLYFEEQLILFSGDHVLFDITPNISVFNEVFHSLADYLGSLNRLKLLNIVQTFPAHRKWLGNTHERIDNIIEHHRNRLQEILQAVEKNPGIGAYDIASHITWSSRGKPWSDFSPNQRWFAVGETLSHLVWLLDSEYTTVDSKRKYFLGENALCKKAISF